MQRHDTNEQRDKRLLKVRLRLSYTRERDPLPFEEGNEMTRAVNHYGWNKRSKELTVWSKEEDFKEWADVSPYRVRIHWSDVPRMTGKGPVELASFIKLIIDIEVGCDDYEPYDKMIEKRKPRKGSSMIEELDNKIFWMK